MALAVASKLLYRQQHWCYSTGKHACNIFNITVPVTLQCHSSTTKMQTQCLCNDTDTIAGVIMLM